MDESCTPKRHIIEVGSRRVGIYLKLLKTYEDIVLEVFEPLKLKAEILEYHISKLTYDKRKRFILNRYALAEEYHRRTEYNVVHPLEYSSIDTLLTRGIWWWNQQPQNVDKQIYIINKDYVKTRSLRSSLFKRRVDYEFLKVKDTIDSININIKGNVLSVLEGITEDYIDNIDIIRFSIIDTPYDIYENQTEFFEVEDLLSKFEFKLYKKVEYPSKKEQKYTFINKRLL